MKTIIAIFGTLSFILTLIPLKLSAVQTKKPGKIFCTESSVDESSSRSTPIGDIIVTLDAAGKATMIQIQRKYATALPAINATFSVQSSDIKHDIVDIDAATARVSGVKKLEIITAKDSKNREFILKINDQLSGPTSGSSYSYEQGKLTLSTVEEATVVNCSGEIKFPKRESEKMASSETLKTSNQ